MKFLSIIAIIVMIALFGLSLYLNLWLTVAGTIVGLCVGGMTVWSFNYTNKKVG